MSEVIPDTNETYLEQYRAERLDAANGRTQRLVIILTVIAGLTGVAQVVAAVAAYL